MTWNLQSALCIAMLVEEFAPKYGCHVALTGGCLYKTGYRKDLDLLFYRIRQSSINFDGLFKALEAEGINIVKDCGFVVKANFGGWCIDLLFPERSGNYYAPVDVDEPSDPNEDLH